jgi:hypothetical protein
VRQASALRASTEAFKKKLIIKAKSTLEFTADDVNIRLVGEGLSPDAAPKLSNMKAATHLDDTEGLTIRAAGPVGLCTWHPEPPGLTLSHHFAAC